MEPTIPREAWLEFQGSSDRDQLEKISLGHIHHTYLVSSNTGPRAILQRLNRGVFPDPEALIANAEAIQPHLQSAMGGRIAPRVLTHANRPCFVDSRQDYWRAFKFIVASRNLESPRSESQCFAAGAAFGSFQQALKAMQESDLTPCIEGFQDLRVVTQRFAEACASDAKGRLSGSRTLAERLRSLEEKASPLSGPMGVIHGDGKFNNLLFNEGEDEVIAVLDLDTVMWHRRALDFGDLARAGAVRGAEDDAEAEIDLGRVRAFAQGFRGTAGDLIPDSEPLVHALLHVTYMLALRFHTDHLNGDIYFQVSEAQDNLRRARGQCALFEQCLRREDALHQAVAA